MQMVGSGENVSVIELYKFFLCTCYRNWFVSTCDEWFVGLLQKVDERQHSLALLTVGNAAAVIFIGTFGALAFGEADLPIDDIAAVCLLIYFGVSTLLDAVSSENQMAEDEQKEVKLPLLYMISFRISGNRAGILAAANTVISTFLLVFVAEWGDKSFLAQSH
ncbi:protein PAM71, chloroplastic-like [Durio zibethinus]|uniref:Protein PAM71, chloroplastic-like n=1 Tax=Durio zibethinus TaxID=66656 RepID=A0A6P6BJR3_DURZI|nr:protein PAM71, chloroplastic-like [Durio zibethinus]